VKLRKVTSLTLFFSFILLLITSAILYIVPHGRIAHWSHWTLWGMGKTEWTNLHVNLGILFVVLSIIHTVLNWQCIIGYIKNRQVSSKGFNLNLLIALIITAFFTIGSYYKVPPLNWFIDISDSIKHRATQKFGEPPYGHAELSTLADFTWKMGLDLEQSLDRLKQANIQVDHPNQTLLKIAEKNQVTPKRIFILLGGDEWRPQAGYLRQRNAGSGSVRVRKFRNRINDSGIKHPERRGNGKND
jgi:hypothetical protein